MFIQLKPLSERGASAQQVIQRLRPNVAGVQGAKFYMQAGQDVTVGARLTQAEYQYTLTDTEFRGTQPLGTDHPATDAKSSGAAGCRLRSADRLAACGGRDRP